MSRKGGASMLSLWQQFELSTTSLLREMRRECASPSSAMKKTKMRRRRLEAVARDSRGRSTTCTHMAPRIQIEKNDAATRVALWLQRRPRGLCLKRWLGGGSLNAVLLARACQGLFFFSNVGGDAKREDRRRGRPVLRQRFCSSKGPRSTVHTSRGCKSPL